MKRRNYFEVVSPKLLTEFSIECALVSTLNVERISHILVSVQCAPILRDCQMELTSHVYQKYSLKKGKCLVDLAFS